MSNKRSNRDSELIKALEIMLESSDEEIWQIAFRARMVPSEINTLIYSSRGTQITKAERLLDAFGYELAFRRKR